MNEYEDYAADKLLDCLASCKAKVNYCKHTYLNSLGMFSEVRDDLHIMTTRIDELYKKVCNMKNQ